MNDSFLKCCVCYCESKLILMTDSLKTLIPPLLSIKLQVPDENEPYLICSSCYDAINVFVSFKARIKKIRKRAGSEKEVTKEGSKKTGESDVLLVQTNDGSRKTDESESLQMQTKNVSKRTDKAQKRIKEIRKDLPSVIPAIYVEPDDYKFISEEAAKSIQTNAVSQSFLKPEPTKTEIQSSAGEKKTSQEEPSSSIFICDQCSYHSCRPKEFSRHVRSHGHLTSHQRICSLCSHVCNSVAALHAHRKEAHPDNPISFKCRICEETFATKLEANSHKEAAHNISVMRNFRCKTCNRIFVDKISRQKHQCRRKPYKCPLECGRRFETTPEVKSHYKSCRPGSTIYTCTRCKKKLCNLQSLKKHDKVCAARHKHQQTLSETRAIQVEKTDHGTAPAHKPRQPDRSPEENSCDEEQEGVDTDICKPTGSFKCKKCCAEFGTVSTLEMHFTKCRGDYSNAKKCFCGTIFLTDKSLELHKLTVHRISAAYQPKRPHTSGSSNSDSDSSNEESGRSKPARENGDLKLEIDVKPTGFSPTTGLGNETTVKKNENSTNSAVEDVQSSDCTTKREPLEDDVEGERISWRNHESQVHYNKRPFARSEFFIRQDPLAMPIRPTYERYDNHHSSRPIWNSRSGRGHQPRFNRPGYRHSRGVSQQQQHQQRFRWYRQQY